MKSLAKSYVINAALLAMLLLNTGCVFHRTKSNEVGVRTRNMGLFQSRGIEQQVYPPAGTYMFLPVLNSWNTFDVNLQNIQMTQSAVTGDMYRQDDLRFKTIDGNDISLDLTISYRVIPEKAPYILGHVARNDQELRDKIVRAIARSRPRDIFAELETEQFYKAELRAQQAEKARVLLNELLMPYGVIVERVLTQTYRYNPAYQQAIEEKEIAEQKIQKFKSSVKAKREEYLRRIEQAKGEVNKMIAKVDGEFERASIDADAYYQKQENISKAIMEEAKAESEGIRKMNQALAEQGGKVLVKLKMAEALNGKKIFLVPASSGQGVDLKTLDLNRFIETEGVRRLAEEKGKTKASGATK